MKYNRLIKFFSSIIICELAGVIGSMFTVSQIDTWYRGLNKPFFNPPNWIFGPVWTTLFILMGISLYLVWQKGLKRKLVLIFALQLILNILWSVIFFKMHFVGLALVELLMLWVAILFTIINFYRVSKAAAYLLIPYILWVSVAGILNLTIFLIN